MRAHLLLLQLQLQRQAADPAAAAGSSFSCSSGCSGRCCFSALAQFDLSLTSRATLAFLKTDFCEAAAALAAAAAAALTAAAAAVAVVAAASRPTAAAAVESYLYKDVVPKGPHLRILWAPGIPI
ncbi:hypothetical protein Emag_000285 [Eimeria magna]